VVTGIGISPCWRIHCDPANSAAFAIGIFCGSRPTFPKLSARTRGHCWRSDDPFCLVSSLSQLHDIAFIDYGPFIGRVRRACASRMDFYASTRAELASNSRAPGFLSRLTELSGVWETTA